MRRGVVAAAMAATLAIVGCSANNQDQDSSIVAVSETDEADQESSFEVEKSDATEFLKRDELTNINPIGDCIQQIVEATPTADFETASTAKNEAYRLCNEIIDMSDVPEPCKKIHERLSDAADCFKESAYYYTESTMESDIDRRADFISMGNDSLNEASRTLDEVSMLISDVKDEYGIVL